MLEILLPKNPSRMRQAWFLLASAALLGGEIYVTTVENWSAQDSAIRGVAWAFVVVVVYLLVVNVVELIVRRFTASAVTDEPGATVTSDGVPWVWDGERAHARCPDHPDTDLLHRGNGAGAPTGVPADRDSLLDDHLKGGHMVCPKHRDDRIKLGEPKTYGEARQRAEEAMHVAPPQSGHGRRGIVSRRGSLKVSGLRSKNLDTAIETEDTETDVEDVDIE